MKKVTTYNEFLNEENSASNPYGKLVMDLLWVKNQALVYHWQTNKFSEHEAFGKFYADYSTNLDTLIELLIGKFGRFNLSLGVINVYDYSEISLQSYLDKSLCFIDCVEDCFEQMGYDIGDDVENVLDTLSENINKLRYLLTLK